MNRISEMHTEVIFSDLEALESRVEHLLQERDLLKAENQKLWKDRKEAAERIQRLMSVVEEEIAKVKTPVRRKRKGRKKKGGKEESE